MEDSLGHKTQFFEAFTEGGVLILVVMEDSLGHILNSETPGLFSPS